MCLRKYDTQVILIFVRSDYRDAKRKNGETKMTTKERNDLIVMAAVQNAVETVYVEKSGTVDEIGRLARYSVQDVIEGNGYRVSSKVQAKLEAAAEKSALSYPRF